MGDGEEEEGEGEEEEMEKEGEEEEIRGGKSLKYYKNIFYPQGSFLGHDKLFLFLFIHRFTF